MSIFTDVDWAGSVTDRISTFEYCTYVWGNLVTWRSKKQGVVARSSVEAEFRAMSQGICEGLWILRVLDKLKMKIEFPLKLYSDSKAAISIAHNPVQHDRIEHIEIDRHFIKEKLDAGIICLPFVTSSQQIANILTKSLTRPSFEHLIDKLGMRYLCTNLRGGWKILYFLFYYFIYGYFLFLFISHYSPLRRKLNVLIISSLYKPA